MIQKDLLFSHLASKKIFVKGVQKIHTFFITSILLLALNISYVCENSKLNFVMRNNINGDFSIVEKISELKPGAFININWNKKELMLPYSLRKDYISFTDKNGTGGTNLIRTDRLILIILLYTNYFLLEKLKHILVN